ncbi:hypothetical protein [Bradyrhizobium sp. STM 3809]|uniref:hypothetical protein n=1 Tax=Bradyrhizobium sp. STM 3809 TaxID=551936 RepID=UPI00024070A2|nr:hypothetical protein [Bradyrhizobium sp. STM 3809]CCD98286.1 membrane hypothetical protein [Bradyrhizobium sp. STM 3809]
MTATSRTRTRWTQLGLLLLVVIPFLPELAIWIVAGFAKIMGCSPGQQTLCLNSPWISDTINWAFKLSAGLIVTHTTTSLRWLIAFFAGLGLWLTGCLVIISLGWRRRSSRLVLGFAITLIFAFLPFLGPGLALLGLAEPEACTPGTGTCKIYGSEVQEAHAAVRLWDLELQPLWIVLAAALFAIYAIATILMGRLRGRSGGVSRTA